MKIKKMNRYFCDHCNKSGGRKDIMESHEKGCTANPNRVCGMCKALECDAKPLPELIAIIDNAEIFKDEEDKWIDTYQEAAAETLKRLSEAADGCPSCIIAALRQSKSDNRSVIWFDAKAAYSEAWKQINEDREEEYREYIATIAPGIIY